MDLKQQITCPDWTKYPIKTIDIPYLYHATVINNEKGKSIMEEYKEFDIPIPSEGKYHTDLKNKKYFTITEHGSYCCDVYDYVFLRYTTAHPLKLIDLGDSLTRFKNSILINYTGWQNLDTFITEKKIDGYMKIEDTYEICLLNPELHVYPEYEQLSKYPDICRDINAINEYYIDTNKYCEQLLNNKVNDRVRPAKIIDLGVPTLPALIDKFGDKY